MEQGFGLAEAAAACGVSTRHLQSVPLARNTTFSRDLANTRVAEAEKLIRSSRGRSIAIAQIAAFGGFASQAYFATCYRRRFGKSPRDDLHV